MRTRRGLQEEPDTVEPARQSQTWLRAESSEALAGINEECLELLTAQSMVRTLQPQPMLCELADLWRSLDAGARRRAAECPICWWTPDSPTRVAGDSPTDMP